MAVGQHYLPNSPVYLFVIAAFALQGQMESNQSRWGMAGSQVRLPDRSSIYQWCQTEGWSDTMQGQQIRLMHCSQGCRGPVNEDM